MKGCDPIISQRLATPARGCYTFTINVGASHITSPAKFYRGGERTGGVIAVNGVHYNIVIVSKDILFLNKMQSLAANLVLSSRITTVGSCAEIQTRLNKAAPAVIVCDADHAAPSDSLLAQLNAAYRLLFIFTGSSPAPVYPNRAINYIPRTRLPDSDAAFLSVARAKINAFVSSCASRDVSGVLPNIGRNQKIIAIAASTGGTDALQKIFLKLDQSAPPVVVVQHMPSGFTKLFADRLNGICKVSVKEAQTNDLLRAGLVLIAPAGLHMTVALSGGRFVAECFDGPRLHGVIPAADHLFNSIAQALKSNAVGVILTGMGSDGARGLANMRGHGAKTIGQDQKTSVVYGMPKAAYELGAVDYQLPIDSIAEMMLALAR